MDESSSLPLSLNLNATPSSRSSNPKTSAKSSKANETAKNGSLNVFQHWGSMRNLWSFGEDVEERIFGRLRNANGGLHFLRGPAYEATAKIMG